GDCDQSLPVLDAGHRATRGGPAALGPSRLACSLHRGPASFWGLCGWGACAVFLGYSALTGVTMAFVFLIYTGESVATTFFITAGMFGATALYGTTTQRSLAGVGQFMFMGLIGIVIASLVGMFWHNDGLQFV